VLLSYFFCNYTTNGTSYKSIDTARTYTVQTALKQYQLKN
jgi:hypothetical protein